MYMIKTFLVGHSQVLAISIDVNEMQHMRPPTSPWEASRLRGHHCDESTKLPTQTATPNFGPSVMKRLALTVELDV